MNNKLLLQDLTDQLAEAGKIKKKDAEEFLRAFFKISEDALFEDGIIKISGLGTLKLVLVDARKSVNVTTGEEFEIREHYKVSYIPDADLKAAVNKPFTHLEPVELDASPVIVPTPTIEKKTSAIKEKATKEEPALIEQPLTEEPSTKEPKKFKRSNLAWILLFLLLVLLGVWSWFSNERSRKEDAIKIQEMEYLDSLEADISLQEDLAAIAQESEPDTSALSTVEDSLDAIIQSVANETKTAKPTVEPIQKIASTATSTKPQATTVTTSTKTSAVKKAPTTTSASTTKSTPVEYITTVVMKPGDRLNLLALKYYGEKVFWVYIYEANKNVIPNPDNVPAGTTIRIPKADPKLIDAKNEALVAKAKALQLKYIGAQ